MPSMTRTIHAPSNGLYSDMEDDDNQRGPERDETDSFHQLVRHLVVEGDRRAVMTGRRARRTLEEMVPGATVPPLLVLAGSAKAADDACVLCGYWRCRCGG